MENKNRFEKIYSEGNGFTKETKTIIVDKETGVNYLFVTYGYAGGITPLLDEQGNPVITR
jgi:hypothetical protein